MLVAILIVLVVVSVVIFGVLQAIGQSHDRIESLLKTLVEQSRNPVAIQQIDGAAERLRTATDQYVEANTVLALAREIEISPELMQKLDAYSRELVAAVYLNRIEYLTKDMKATQGEISYYEGLDVKSPGIFKIPLGSLKVNLDRLNNELQAAQAALRSIDASATP
jgi:hypothetical protein